LGFTVSWLEASGVGRAAHASLEWLKTQPTQCPKCEQPTFGDATPGVFECKNCGTKVAYTEHIAVPHSQERVERTKAFEEAAQTLLDGAPWLDQSKGSRLQYAALLVIAGATLLCLHALLLD
ncbi:MAG: hypothetical protein AAF645_15225, partial [Myxococcota bacterium]